MKNILILIIISLFATIACNDEFMDRYPPDKISDVTFWNTAADVEMYANQFYPDLFDARIAWYVDDNRSDNQVHRNKNTYIWGEYTVPTTGGGWGKSDWRDIRSCNYALSRITQIEDVSEAEAEIRFFKAFYYFDKVKQFGDVPWYEKDLGTDSEELFEARDSRETVIANILDELDFAIENLPEESSENRLTKYAALTFKAQVCLYEGTYRKYHNVVGEHEALLREAVNACEEIINSGLFSVWSTGNPQSDYFDLFVQYDLNGNSEGIMIQHFITDKRMHNNVRQLGEQHSGLSKDFVNTYLCTDGLPISLSPLYQGDAEWGDEFIDRDPRMRQSTYDGERPYRIYEDGSVDYKEMPEFRPGNAVTSYFVTKGYSPYEKDRLPSTSTTDDFIFRYGKVLLDYAEAKAELGEATQEVLDKSINKLRDRVGMPHLTVDVGFEDPNWPEWETPVSPLINEIRRERRLETYAEGMRWDDLVRWKAGVLLENPLTYRGATDPETGEPRVIYPGTDPRTWDDKLYLFPLPRQELTLNEKLTQNPGWEN